MDDTSGLAGSPSSRDEGRSPAAQHGRQDQSEVRRVFEQFKSYIDTRLGDLAGSLQSATRDQAEDNRCVQASTKKLQRDADALKFRYKGNAK